MRLLHSPYTAEARARNGLEHRLIINILRQINNAYIYINAYRCINAEQNIGRSRICKKLRGAHVARAELRHSLKTHSFIRDQTYRLSSNLDILKRQLEKSVQANTNDKLKGLIAVFLELTVREIGPDDKENMQSILTMKYVTSILTEDDKKTFLGNLLNRRYGLCIDVVTMWYILLRFYTGWYRKVLDTVETEWDRKVVRVLLGANLSRASVDKLGFNIHKLAKSTERVVEVFEQ